ncbi:MAG TPA: RIP metalloprotease RseP [Ferrovibrio sp.]|jgi:regulator of sigma E protease|uniref:RIP metalloprotease RseP n=1 Tax=Ferrovibrio sp. TaxID=1917215 RepID=UPI002B4B53B5|nr:RIP metalloprotease RseP [Ferrovibrio sp.]HLT79309.1 RIP metalloprotease RseP [Ferrovibrio sp.]
MDFITNLAAYVIPFVIVLTIIVFVHELGHYWVARRCGVRVEVFSIGFGRELFGWNDRHGTRWKISAIPLGGFVKFFGDADATSNADNTAVAAMSDAERRVSFHHQPLGARTAIVAAGPVANFIFAILIYAGLFSLVGQPFTPPVVGSVVEGGAAEAAGLMPGDRILSADGTEIQRFEELRAFVGLRAETPIDFRILRDGEELSITVVPQRVDVADGLGGTQRVGQIGIRTAGVEFVRHDPATAVVQAVRETWQVVANTFTYLGRIVAGRESGDQLSGPLGIAKMSGDVAKASWLGLVSLMATLSVAIGLINLFPVPMLDGGHLLFYGVEALRGRPLGERAQEYGFRIGFALVLSLFLFATWNDLNRLPIFNFLTGLFS